MMATGILKAEFPEITNQFIYKTASDHYNLFPIFLALAKAREEYELGFPLAFGRGRITRRSYANEVVGEGGSHPHLRAELEAATRHADYLARQRAAERAVKQKEADNIKIAKAAGAVAECQACFDEMPMNRQIHCDGVVAHFTCFTCAEAYIKAEVGQSRCRVLCTAGCGAGFAPAQINLLADKELLARLARIQQATDIRNAGIEDLEECPFCDYKAIVDVDVDEDSEFRCAAPDCSIVSCRRCHAKTHLPQTCKEAEAERRLDGRHRIEEAMTAALVRHCNRCRQKFIKESGCNKMICSACHNLQCYCCGETVTDYTHFENERIQAVVAAIDVAVAHAQPAQQGAIAPNIGAGAIVAAQAPQRLKKCPLYDNVEERHKRDVEQAERLARAAVIAENPNVTAEELAINLPADPIPNAPTNPGRRVYGAVHARPRARAAMDPLRDEQRRQRGLARLQDQQAARARRQEVFLQDQVARERVRLNRLHLKFQQVRNQHVAAANMQQQERMQEAQREVHLLRQQQDQAMLDRQAELYQQLQGMHDVLREQQQHFAENFELNMPQMPLFDRYAPAQPPAHLHGGPADLAHAHNRNDFFAAAWYPAPAPNNGGLLDGHQAAFAFANRQPEVIYWPAAAAGAEHQNVPRNNYHAAGGHAGLGHNDLGDVFGIADRAVRGVFGIGEPLPNDDPARPPLDLRDGGFQATERRLDRLDMLRRPRLEQTQQRRAQP
jgi:TRIAD3 protein (E3 ubiquitin-protein ligase RNF216)